MHRRERESKKRDQETDGQIDRQEIEGERGDSDKRGMDRQVTQRGIHIIIYIVQCTPFYLCIFTIIFNKEVKRTDRERERYVAERAKFVNVLRN